MRLQAMCSILIGVVAALTVAPPTLAQTRGKHVQAELLADVAAVKPGQPFTLGVRLKIDPKWHVYWINPGETGLPTEVTFTLPDGFTAGPLRFPIPKSFTQPGDIVGYGYEDEVLLLAQVTPPADARGDVTIDASAEWLVCEKVCLPGSAKLSLTLPVAEAGAPANTELFATWRAKVPVDQQDQAKPTAAVLQVQADTNASGPRVVNTVRVTFDQPPRSLEWFPPGHAALDIADAQVDRDGTAARVTVAVSALQGMKQWTERLEGLLVYTTQDGKRLGVTVPVVAPPPPEPSPPAAAAK